MERQTLINKSSITHIDVYKKAAGGHGIVKRDLTPKKGRRKFPIFWKRGEDRPVEYPDHPYKNKKTNKLLKELPSHLLIEETLKERIVWKPLLKINIAGGATRDVVFETESELKKAYDKYLKDGYVVAYKN